MFIVSRPQPRSTKSARPRRHHLAGRAARRVGGEEGLEAVLVDAHAVAHGLELRLALHRRARSNSLVERHELEAVERAVVAHGHHVVEPVDADAAPARVARPLGDRLARPVVEDLLDPRRPVLAHVAGLAREDDERLAVRGHDDVGVAVHDLEAGQVRDGALEAGVLAAGHDERVQLVLGHRPADVVVAPVQLCPRSLHSP